MRQTDFFTRLQLSFIFLCLVSDVNNVTKIQPSGEPRAQNAVNDMDERPWGWEEHRDGQTCLQNVIKSFALPSIDKNNKDEAIKSDYDITESGITSNLDITNILLQYFHWPTNTRSQISHCNLNMDRALKRCMSVYGNDENGKNTCEIIADNGVNLDSHRFLGSKQQHLPSNYNEQETEKKDGSDIKLQVPFVTRKCPDGYKRYGCCKCVRSCKSAGIALRDENDKPISDSYDNALYCPKPRSYRSNHYKNLDDCNANCEIYGDQFYVQKCSDGFQRVGADLCMAECPHGWPDLGDQCLKVGHLELIPFPWAIGDGQHGGASK